MLAGLGMFVFDASSTLFEGISRDRAWSHERSARFGARDASQFTGPGPDRITISGSLIPELAGDYGALETLAEMADDGEAYPLADGLGNVIGNYTIEGIREVKSNLIDTGQSRRNDFTLELARVA